MYTIALQQQQQSSAFVKHKGRHSKSQYKQYACVASNTSGDILAGEICEQHGNVPNKFDDARGPAQEPANMGDNATSGG
jgi:hypothetical protein